MAGTILTRTRAKLSLRSTWFKPAYEQFRPLRAASLLEGETSARNAWRRLTDLDETHLRDKAELRTSGVSERRITNLYPHEFEDLVPGMLRVLVTGPPRNIDDATLRQISLLGTELSRPADFWDDWMRGETEAACLRLKSHFDLIIPYSSEDPERTSNMAYHLWQSYWLMKNIGQCEDADGVRRLFLSVIDWLLPSLIDEVDS